MPLSLKVKKADITIENGRTLKDLQKQVTNKTIPQIYQELGYLEANN